MNIFDYVKIEENSFKTERVPITASKDWNFPEHIERCVNVSNGWFHQGKNDGTRPYDDIASPIIDVSFRTEGFDVKDIVPYVDDVDSDHLSFLAKTYHPQWARKNKLDTLIDEVVESSIIFDLVLLKKVDGEVPQVIKLQDLAFCDQTDILSGAIGIKHYFTIPELLAYKGKWKDDKIDECIVMAKAEKEVSTARGKKARTPSKYIEVYEVRGNFPKSYLDEEDESEDYSDQLHIITYYTDTEGTKNGICLYKGKEISIKKRFKALKIDQVRSHGRAAGRSIVERLFEPVVWNNYSGIKLKKMLDSSVNLLQTDSDEFGNKKISDLKEMTVLKHEPGRPISRVDMGLQNFTQFQSEQDRQKMNARMLGSASEASLGLNPSSGTPFALNNQVIQQGEGIHEYRKGKISIFFADELYPDWILPLLVEEMDNGKTFSENLSLDEMQEVIKKMGINFSNQRIKELTLEGKTVSKEEQAIFTQLAEQKMKSKGQRGFFEIIKGELKKIPIKVMVNVAGKQKYLARDADKLSNMISTFLRSGVPLQQLAKPINELLEYSGMMPVDFSSIVNPPAPATPGVPTAEPSLPPIQAGGIIPLPTNQ